MGVVKTKMDQVFFNIPNSWFTYRLSSKFYLVDIFQIPNKIKQNPKFHPTNPLSHPISSSPTKIKHFSHFQTKKSNFHFAKNSPTISKSSLFISTFTDNDFRPKITQNILSLHSPLQGYLKTTHNHPYKTENNIVITRKIYY